MSGQAEVQEGACPVWEIRVAKDGRRVHDAEPLIPSDRTADVIELPAEGGTAFDACVDALIGKFHMPEAHAASVVQAVIGTLGGDRG